MSGTRRSAQHSGAPMASQMVSPSVASVGRRFGGHSMTATLRSVLVRLPAAPATEHDWREFGYLHPVDRELTERQHAAFRDILAGDGIEVVADGPDEPGHLDAIFAYDPSLMTDRGAVRLRMGKDLR